MKEFEELMDFSPSSPFALFTYYSDNLGDHIQTLALLQHVKAKKLLLRDHLTPHPDLCLLANGWLTVGELPNKKDFRDVKYVGVHLAPHCRSTEAVSAMKECGIIGCRDGVTFDFLERHGAPARLVGCATLTFPRYAGKRQGVYCVDVSDEIKETAMQIYKNPIFVSHDLGGLSLDEVDDDAITDQYRRAHSLLTAYMKAELVITSRVHTTLPCIAFGTPVTYVGVPKSVDDRVSVLDGLGVKTVNGASSRDLRIPVPGDASALSERYLEFLKRCMADAR
ncbi:MAG TPA: polysaccharide pyruvyl transferase family protein [Candidatus Binatia bacterium]|jgi:hypothetical protein